MPINENQDSTDLEALFDSIVAENHALESGVSGNDAGTNSSVIEQIGHLTRMLHDALRELGLNKEIERVIATIPDARDRLNYISSLTEKAAEQVLNATDAAQPVVDSLERDAQRLSHKWQMLFNQQLSPEQFKHLVAQTRDFLEAGPDRSKAINAQLMEIMMAQDFQDLTGQVIKKVFDITRKLEQQLVALLLDSAPPEVKAEFDADALQNGPVINPDGRSDVVTNQMQVDDLLASLGF